MLSIQISRTMAGCLLCLIAIVLLQGSYRRSLMLPPAYTGIHHSHSASTTITVTSAGVFAPITGPNLVIDTDVGPFNVTVPDNILVIGAGGNGLAQIFIGGAVTGPASNVDVTLFKSTDSGATWGEIEACEFISMFDTATAGGGASLVLTDVAEGDWYQPWLTSQGGDDVIVHRFNFVARRILNGT